LFETGTDAAIQFAYGRRDLDGARDSELPPNPTGRLILRFRWDEQQQRLMSQP